MNYNIKGTSIDITPELREYVEKKLANLDKLVSDTAAARADVELEFLSGEAKTHRAEIMLHDPRLSAPIRAEARAAGMHEAIDMAVGQLTGELTRTKKKRLHHVRRGAARVKEFIRGFRGKL